jgi:hypothetical protein
MDLLHHLFGNRWIQMKFGRTAMTVVSDVVIGDHVALLMNFALRIATHMPKNPAASLEFTSTVE